MEVLREPAEAHSLDHHGAGLVPFDPHRPVRILTLAVATALIAQALDVFPNSTAVGSTSPTP